MIHTISEQLQKEAHRANITFLPEEIKDLELYVQELCRWGNKINLTSKPDIKHIVTKQFPDAFFIASYLIGENRQRNYKDIVDVGAGAGLTGIVLAILLKRHYPFQIHFVEPSIKRCSFLRTICYQLHLPSIIHQSRIESLYLIPQDIAFSRATWSPEKWILKGTTLLKPKGTLILFITDDSKRPISIETQAKLILKKKIHYSLEEGSSRCIMIYNKIDQDRSLH